MQPMSPRVGAVKQSNRKRLWIFRGLAILLGVAPFAATEVGLRILDLPRLPPPTDPYVDLHALKPLFEQSEAEGEFAIGAERMNLFRPASFRMPKPAGTYRIFALGGSTTQGEPYSTPTAFPEWARVNLQAAAEITQAGSSEDVGRTYEVINCGGLSYASYRVLAILKEVLTYDPDLVVIYTGHNEYLEKRSYQGFERENLWARLGGFASNLRMVQLGKMIVASDSLSEEESRGSETSKTELQAEVDALLDYRGGLEDYRRGDAWRAPVVEHFRWNLEQMVAACKDADVPLVLFRPVTNLLDCPPMKFELSPSLNDAEAAEFEEAWETGRLALQQGDLAQAETWLRDALKMDPEHAGANFLLGRLLYEAAVEPGDFEEAKRYLVAARDFDVCPLRATSALISVVDEVVADSGTPCVDAAAVLSGFREGWAGAAAEIADPIIGDRMLVDHVHPTVEGHQRLGEALFDLLAERAEFRIDAPAVSRDAWRSLLGERYREHLETLGEDYFIRAKQRLAGLQLWTQGRAKKVRDVGNETLGNQ